MPPGVPPSFRQLNKAKLQQNILNGNMLIFGGKKKANVTGVIFVTTDLRKMLNLVWVFRMYPSKHSGCLTAFPLSYSEISGR
jgi:hypothetical protein